MKNIRIEPTVNHTFVVRADTPRFGEHAIMFESCNAAECSEYLAAHGNKSFQPEPADDVALLYSDNLREDACIGHLRGDFGSSGEEFWATWWPHKAHAANTIVFKSEFDALVNYLRTNLLASLSSMRRYISVNPSMHIPHVDDGYGYRIQTGRHDNYIRCSLFRGDYNFNIFCYLKEA